MTRSKATSESVKSSTKEHNGSTKDNKQWIFIMKDSALKSDQSSDVIIDDPQPTICKLRHPRLDSAVLFLLSADNRTVCELNSFDEKYHSWFIGNSVHNGNEMLFTTPLDPLFLLIPYLINGGKKYQQLDQLVTDSQFPATHRLTHTVDRSQLMLVADCKDIDDDLSVYRYNRDKTLAWIKAKVASLSETLEEKKINVSTKSSQSSMFIRSNNTTESKDSFTNYAFGMIGNYLSMELESEAREFLGIVEVEEKPALKEKSENEPPKKKQKLGEAGAPTDDYSLGADAKKDKKNVKLTPAQKKLQQTDKTGMKSISSFFSPKSNKK